ncbi:Sodium/glucose cotransporter 4 [Desmophyllum pertusum]|uniref:Sodium/glucose cotransporter 4 n=1 Tax=Desmophyllum pertusum TaxID=174260 RepID=A0A9W9Z9T9_9CNID|nr:Sodium/glucose cotransporter 4 [Desmophyllum pertusum]
MHVSRHCKAVHNTLVFEICNSTLTQTKFRQQRGKAETAETFFLARTVDDVVGDWTSLFVSNIGSEHFIGLAGSGAATGIGVGSYEWQAPFILLLLGWVFVPIYLKSRVDIYAGSVFLYEAVGWNIYISAACVLAITAVYTVLGGLTAVFFTDVLQCTVMIIGAIVVAIMSFSKVGGMDGLWEKYGTSMGQSIATTAAPNRNSSSPACSGSQGPHPSQSRDDICWFSENPSDVYDGDALTGVVHPAPWNGWSDDGGYDGRRHVISVFRHLTVVPPSSQLMYGYELDLR